MSALLNCEIDPSQEVEGVPGALSMLEDLYNEHRHDIEIVKSVSIFLLQRRVLVGIFRSRVLKAAFLDSNT